MLGAHQELLGEFGKTQAKADGVHDRRANKPNNHRQTTKDQQQQLVVALFDKLDAGFRRLGIARLARLNFVFVATNLLAGGGGASNDQTTTTFQQPESHTNYDARDQREQH